MILLVVLFGYLVGMIHGSKIVEWFSGINLKEVGTNNAGASNAFISAGAKWGVFVFVTDIGKAIVAVLIVSNFLDSNDLTLLYATVLGLFLGHCFPFYMNFNGGKGTAVLIGGLTSIDFTYGLVAFIIFVLLAVVTNYLIYGLMVYYLISFINMIILTESAISYVVLIIIIGIGLFLHKSNFKRIRKKEEPLFRDSFKRKKKN